MACNSNEELRRDRQCDVEKENIFSFNFNNFNPFQAPRTSLRSIHFTMSTYAEFLGSFITVCVYACLRFVMRFTSKLYFFASISLFALRKNGKAAKGFVSQSQFIINEVK